MKIVIDVYPCQGSSRFRGIGRYALDFVSALINETKRNHEIILLANALREESFEQLRKYFISRLPADNFIPYVIPLKQYFKDLNEYNKAVEICYSHLYSKISADISICLSPFEGFHEDDLIPLYIPFKECSINLTILYDFIPLIFKKQYLSNSNYSSFYYERLKAIQSFDHYLCISETTKKDGIKYIKKDTNKFSVIYAGLNEIFKNSVNALPIKKLQEKDGFILYSGNLDFRKNLNGMLEAYALLPSSIKNKLPIVFTYIHLEPNEFEKLVLNYGIHKNQYLFLNHVPDLKLKWLYQNCTLFCMPSLYEGFGLPVIEAIACGAKVIVSNNSSLKEIVSDEENLCDPYNINDFSNKILKLVTSPQSQQSISKKKNNNFSWSKVASKTAKIIDNLQIIGHKYSLKKLDSNDPIFTSDSFIKCVQFNLSSTDKRKIVVEVTQISKIDALTGIQRVVKNYIDILGKLNETVLIWINNSKFFICQYNSGSFDRTNVEYSFSPGETLFKIDSSWEYINQHVSIYPELNKIGVRIIEMIYDLIPIRYPQYCHQGLIPVFQHWLNLSLKHADSFICISKATADDLISYYGNNNFNNSVTIYYNHLGSNPLIEEYSEFNIKNDFFEANDPIFLMVGTIEPRKGHQLVFETFKELWGEGKKLKLCLIGKQGWNVEQLVSDLKKESFQENFLWLDNADDSLLNHGYQKSSAVIMASATEGFGLPIIEALQKNKPVIASDIPVFREIGGNNITYFERSTVELKKSILEFISNENVQNTDPNFKALSWQESTENLLKQISGIAIPYYDSNDFNKP